MMSLIDKLFLYPSCFSLLTSCRNGSMFLDLLALLLLISKAAERLGIWDWLVVMVNPISTLIFGSALSLRGGGVKLLPLRSSFLEKYLSNSIQTW